MPESTQGEEKEPPRRTWDRVPQEIGEEVPERSRDTEVKETNQSGFDPEGVKSLLNVNERDKGVLMTAEAQGVHEAEGHGVGTPAETALERVELWKKVGGGNASVNEVLENFESARCERKWGGRSQEKWGHHRA